MDYNNFLQRGGKHSSLKKSLKKTSSKISSKISSKKPSKKPSKKSSKKLSKCSQGQIMRNGYTTRTGTKIPPGCIQAQSNSGRKTSLELSRYLAKKESIHKKAREKFPKQASKKCSKGYIMREGYKKNSFKSHSKTGKKTSKDIWVAPGCIKSVTGKSKKGTKLITIMDKDVLAKYGYENIKNMNQSDRHKALRKAIRDNKPLSIYRRIIAIATLNKNKDKILYKILRLDAEWIQSRTEYIVRTSKKTSKKPSKIQSKRPSKKLSKKFSKNIYKKSSKKLSKNISKKSSKK